MKMTGLVYDEKMLLHCNPWNPFCIEDPERLTKIWSKCVDMELVKRCIRVETREAEDSEVEEYHDKAMLKTVEDSKDMESEELQKLCSKYEVFYMNNRSAEVAKLAAGSCIQLLDKLLSGDIRNGMALVRPPGHHASSSEMQGFCVYNNVVLTTKAALKRGISKILIVDFDVHHGNGTQDAFYDDPRVLYMSIHGYYSL